MYEELETIPRASWYVTDILEKYGEYLKKGLITKSLYHHVLVSVLSDTDVYGNFDPNAKLTPDLAREVHSKLIYAQERHVANMKNTWFSLFYILLLYRYGRQSDSQLQLIKSTQDIYISVLHEDPTGRLITSTEIYEEFKKASKIIARKVRISETKISNDMFDEIIDMVKSDEYYCEIYPFVDKYAKDSDIPNRLHNIIFYSNEMCDKDGQCYLIPYEFPNKC